MISVSAICSTERQSFRRVSSDSRCWRSAKCLSEELERLSSGARRRFWLHGEDAFRFDRSLDHVFVSWITQKNERNARIMLAHLT